jgi:hypothetical protein
MKLDGISTTALIALAAFAVDRIVSAVLFILLYIHVLPDPGVKSGADQIAAERTYKLVYFIASLVLVIALLQSFSSIRILAGMGLRGDAPLLDAILTGIVLLGGTERLGAWMRTDGIGTGTVSTEQPIQVTGKLTLDDKRP